MDTRVLKPKHGPTLLVRPLPHGDVRTVIGVFERLGERSRRTRFNAPKPCLTRSELRQLASVNETRHALVAYLEGDPQPVAIARLVREGDSAEIAFAVADEHQRRGIGSALTRELVADARAAGITEITALVSSDNPAAVALLRRIANKLHISFEGPELIGLHPRQHARRLRLRGWRRRTSSPWRGANNSTSSPPRRTDHDPTRCNESREAQEI